MHTVLQACSLIWATQNGFCTCLDDNLLAVHSVYMNIFTCTTIDKIYD